MGRVGMDYKTIRKVFDDGSHDEPSAEINDPDENEESCQEALIKNPPEPTVSERRKGGRPKGALNYVTREVRQIALDLVRDPIYQLNLRERMRSGTLGAMEPIIWFYAFGRPTERIQIEAGQDDDYHSLAFLTDDALATRAQELLAQLKELDAVRNAIDVSTPPTPGESESDGTQTYEVASNSLKENDV